MSNSDEESETQRREAATSKELRILSSHNRPGTEEDIIGARGTRTRLPSAAAAKTKYEIARDILREKLDILEDPNRGTALVPRIRGESNAVQRAEQDLLYAADEFKAVSEKLGATAEIKEVENEVVSLQT